MELESSASRLNQSILDPGPAGGGWFDGFRGCYTGVAVVNEVARMWVPGACLRFGAIAGFSLREGVEEHPSYFVQNRVRIGCAGAGARHIFK